MDETTAKMLSDIIEGAGIVGFAIIIVWAVITDKIMSSARADKNIATIREENAKMIDAMKDNALLAAKQVSDEVRNGIEHAVEQGIVKGIHEVRNGESTKTTRRK